MNTLLTSKIYADGSILTQAQLDSAFTSIESVVNGGLDTETNIDFSGIIRFSLNTNDYFNFDDTNNRLDLFIDGVAVLRLEESAATFTFKTLVSDADMIFNINDGGTDTPILTITGSTGNATFAKNLTVSQDLITTSPHITAGIQDANGNEIIDLEATASAVNQLKVTNSATGNPVKIDAVGDDTNVNLDLDAKGTGIIQFRQAGVPQVVALTDASTITTDASLGNIFTVTLGASRTLGNPTNPTNGQAILWIIRQDAMGSRTLTLDSAFRKASELTITLSTAANAIDYLGAVYNGTDSKWDIILFFTGIA